MAGRYRLDGVIGEGSMGTVWAATDEVLLRRVAIKQIKYPPGTPAVEVTHLQHRLLREARAVAALSHPNVITVYDVLTTESGPMIVMELLRSRPLTEIVRQQGRLSPQHTARIGAAVGSALATAHARGITHRDVKPANVLITDDGRVTLTDFGIARNTDEHTMTGTGLILGSPAYIAPEIARGQPIGPASDAWSLSALLFYCLEGRPPFDQGTAIATLYSVVKDPVPPHPHAGDRRYGPDLIQLARAASVMVLRGAAVRHGALGTRDKDRGCARHAVNTALRAEITDITVRLDTRKIIERAQGLLMTRLNMTEPEAFR